MKLRICLTGGIACGKSLFARFLNEFGVATLDADDIVHELVPQDERRRLAKVVFADAAARKELEARIHPLVRARLRAAGGNVVAVVPLVFEVGWEGDFDRIVCVASSPERQLRRMMETRGLSEPEARARLAAQLPIAEKAARSDEVVWNDGTAEELREKARRFAAEFGGRDGRGSEER